MVKKSFFIFIKIIGGFLVSALLIFAYVNIPVKTPQTPYTLGVTFSWRHSQNDLGLDWKAVYTGLLDDLHIRKIRIPVYWDYIEAEQGIYNWDHLDYEVAQAEKRDAKLILAIGRKVPRWPECFIPQWAQDDENVMRAALLRFIPKVIARYKNSPAVEMWQIENEPFLEYGLCPPFDITFFDQELAVARVADPSRPILITDSGELSTWLPAARRGDVFGTTMYRNVYTQKYGAWTYPIGPRFFATKRWIIKRFAQQPHAIVIELQGEPWLAGSTTAFPIVEQLASMNGKKLRANVAYARQGGFDTIYLWGVEWWYYVQEKHGVTSVWDAARELFASGRATTK